jgi:hypothetical protein
LSYVAIADVCFISNHLFSPNYRLDSQNVNM